MKILRNIVLGLSVGLAGSTLPDSSYSYDVCQQYRDEVYVIGEKYEDRTGDGFVDRITLYEFKRVVVRGGNRAGNGVTHCTQLEQGMRSEKGTSFKLIRETYFKGEPRAW